MLKRWRRNRWLRHHRLPDEVWQDLLAHVPLVRGLSPTEQEQLHDLVTLFLREKVFQGAGDLQMNDVMRLIVAIQACLPILHLGLDYYAGWVEVLLYPAGFMAPHEYRDEYGVVHIGQRELTGEAWQHGPVILSWDEIEEDLAYPGEGANVVIHELAHKLDMLDGSPNGLPPLPRDMPLSDWTRAFEAAYADLRERVERDEWTTLDPYAATHPAELFAVVTEAFFDAPWILTGEYPSIYRQLSLFFRQDPAGRVARPAGEQP